MISFQQVIIMFLILEEISTLEESNCTVLMEHFGKVSSTFVLCSIYNSRPITVCQGCVDVFLEILNSYERMKNYSENGTTCLANYNNLDRLQIVETIYNNNYELWNRAKCYECFQVVNGKITTNRSAETIEFDKKYTYLMNCANSTNSSELCTTCMQNYLDLNVYYESISNENEKIGVCMDIVDLMNTTRTMWSKNCCEYRRHNEYIFVISATFILLSTVAFYCLAHTCATKRTPTIWHQNRFAGSLSQMNQTIEDSTE